MSRLSPRIRKHYDLLAPIYYLLWGQHVHHGYWDDTNDTTVAKFAQERLLKELYAFADEPKVEQMLDIGCGYGGTLRWFATRHGVKGMGITLSPAQHFIASLKNRLEGHTGALDVRVADAQQAWDIAPESVDLVWCMECSEHLSDRLHLQREAYRVLKPGGSFCLAAWLASPDESASAKQLREEVERGMLCYPFATVKEYQEQAVKASFEGIKTKIVTENVLRTWDLSIERRDHPIASGLSRLLGSDVSAFTKSFDDLRQAYLEGAMDYGFMVARKP